MGQPLSLKIIACLAIAQGFAGLLRAFNWIEIGVDLFGQGLLLLPTMGLLAVLRGLVIAIVALLYVLYAITALLGMQWARWICAAAAMINLLLVLSSLAQGVSIGDAILWSAIPVILLAYVFYPAGRSDSNARHEAA